jgi:hypothetical protein
MEKPAGARLSPLEADPYRGLLARSDQRQSRDARKRGQIEFDDWGFWPTATTANRKLFSNTRFVRKKLEDAGMQLTNAPQLHDRRIQ